MILTLDAPSDPTTPPSAPGRSRLRRTLAGLAAVAMVAGLTVAATASPAVADDPGAEQTFVSKINQERASRGISGLSAAPDLAVVAQQQSNRMAASGSLYHNPNLATDVKTWTRVSENVGYSTSLASLHTALMASPGHAANILDRGVSQVGVGVTWAGSRIYVTEVFRQPSSAYVAPAPGPAPAPAPAPAPPAPTAKLWLLRETPDPGGTSAVLSYGSPQDTTVACDFDGDGKDNVAVYNNGWWAVRTAPGAGPASAVFAYGDRTMRPVCGDWDGDGKDGIGVYDANGGWWLRNSATPGGAELRFAYGWGAATPVVGDWNGGNGPDGIGVFDGGLWLLRSTPSAGAANAASVAYGWRGARPVPGDWNGDGATTLGIYQDGAWFVRDALTPGDARRFAYGTAGYEPVVADWDGVGPDGIAVTRPN